MASHQNLKHDSPFQISLHETNKIYIRKIFLLELIFFGKVEEREARQAQLSQHLPLIAPSFVLYRTGRTKN